MTKLFHSTVRSLLFGLMAFAILSSWPAKNAEAMMATKFCFCHNIDTSTLPVINPTDNNAICTSVSAFDELKTDPTAHFDHYLCLICMLDPTSTAYGVVCDDILHNGTCGPADSRGECNGCGNCDVNVPGSCDLNPGEQCDDGNNQDGDGCSSSCQIETCAAIDDDQDGFSLCQDCDDNNPDVHPGAAELCNGIDDNCNGQIDEDLGTTTCGVGSCARTIDNCVDGVPQTCVPGEPASISLICQVGADNNCNGTSDEFESDCGSGILAGCISLPGNEPPVVTFAGLEKVGSTVEIPFSIEDPEGDHVTTPIVSTDNGSAVLSDDKTKIIYTPSGPLDPHSTQEVTVTVSVMDSGSCQVKTYQTTISLNAEGNSACTLLRGDQSPVTGNNRAVMLLVLAGSAILSTVRRKFVRSRK